MRRKSKNPYVLIVIVTAVALFAITRVPETYHNWLDEPANEEAELQSFEVELGQNGKTVASLLEEQNLITSEWAFYWYLKQNGLDTSIQTGIFYLSAALTPREIAEAITGGSGESRVTFLEGWTIDRMDEKLADTGLTHAGNFKSCAEESCEVTESHTFLENASSLEGYLFPDTYFLNLGTYSDEGMVNTMLDNFETRFLTDDNLAAIESSGRTLDQIVIMASIVEREEINDDERATIAGILWKRYDNDWGLEADATLLYVLGNDTPLNASNLDTDTPYNTRKYRGLPPTAIGNPGLASLEAALYPEDSPYWFYLHDSEGNVHYATTNDEHNSNKAEWLY